MGGAFEELRLFFEVGDVFGWRSGCLRECEFGTENAAWHGLADDGAGLCQGDKTVLVGVQSLAVRGVGEFFGVELAVLVAVQVGKDFVERQARGFVCGGGCGCGRGGGQGFDRLGPGDAVILVEVQPIEDGRVGHFLAGEDAVAILVKLLELLQPGLSGDEADGDADEAEENDKKRFFHGVLAGS